MVINKSIFPFFTSKNHQNSNHPLVFTLINRNHEFQLKHLQLLNHQKKLSLFFPVKMKKIHHLNVPCQHQMLFDHYLIDGKFYPFHK